MPRALQANSSHPAASELLALRRQNKLDQPKLVLDRPKYSFQPSGNHSWYAEKHLWR